MCCTWGDAQIAATKDLPQFVVESSVGYRHSWTKYRVFPSYAWMHFHLGYEKRFEGNRWYDVVIPNAVDLDAFDFCPASKSDELVFLGRLNDDKGVAIAIEVARRAGRPIALCGPGDPRRFLKHLADPHPACGHPLPRGEGEGSGQPSRQVRFLPSVGLEGRRALLSQAAGLICPTQYIEPFGNVAIEAMASGTPVISTDWGGFSETVLHGITGWRCRTMEQFVWAARNLGQIDPASCRTWAVENYSPERISGMYEEYFGMLLDLAHGGWYHARPGRTQLDWLRPLLPACAAASGGSVCPPLALSPST